ncbi:MAG: putative ABC transporter permease [Bacilli bacterium]
MIISKYFLLFVFYSFLGWLMEVTQGYVRHKKFVNRGFLIGPYCPIYGYGAISMTLLLKGYANDPIVLFVMAIVICSILEYTTSFVMEKLFKIRWWDYSNRKFNINGRICLETMIPFGILGCLMIYFVNPFIFAIIDMIPSNLINIIAVILFIIYLVDNAVSITIISNLKDITLDVKGDSTEKVTKEVRKRVLAGQQTLYKRIVKAFSSFKVVRKK